MYDDDAVPFTRAQALDHGLTDRRLARECRRVLHGVYVAREVTVTPVVRARAALLTHTPTAVASHGTVARLFGVPHPREDVEHVTVPTGDDRRRRRGVLCHVAAVDAEDLRLFKGVRITSPERLFVDLAGTLALVDVVVVGDWLVRHRFLTLRGLLSYCQSSSSAHARTARLAASYVRARVDSPMETRLRMLLVLAGLPEPLVNLEIRVRGGRALLRLDLSWPSIRLAVEYDGQHHRDDTRQWESDVDRREDLHDADWRHITVTRRGIYLTPEQTIWRVWSALRERGWPRLRPPKEAWRRHFPVSSYWSEPRSA